MKEKEVRRLVRQAIIEKFEDLRAKTLPVMSESELREIVKKKLNEGVVSKVLEK